MVNLHINNEAEGRVKNGSEAREVSKECRSNMFLPAAFPECRLTSQDPSKRHALDNACLSLPRFPGRVGSDLNLQF